MRTADDGAAGVPGGSAVVFAYPSRLAGAWLRLVWGGAALAVGALLGLVAGRFPPLFALAAAVGSVALVIILRAPEVGLLTTVLLSAGFVAPTDLPQLPFGPFDLNLGEVILFAQLVHAAAQALASRNVRGTRTPLSGLVLWFLAVVLVSAIYAVVHHGTDLFFVISRVRILLFYASFLVVVGLIATRQQVRRLVGGLYSIALALALASVAQAVFPSFRLSGGMARALATAGQAHEGVLRVTLPGLPLIYLMLVVSLCDLALQGDARWLLRFLRTLALGVGIILAFERNYWLTLGLVFGAALMVIGTRPRRRIVRAAAVTLLLVALTVTTVGGDVARYLTATRDRVIYGLSSETLAGDRSAQMRIIEAGYALESITRHPLFGIGIGVYYRPAVPEDAYWQAAAGRSLRYYIHNAYLWTAVSTGIMGLAPLVAFLSLAVLRGLMRWRRIGDPWARGVVLGLSLGVAGQAISNLVTPNLLEAPALVVYPTVIGVIEVVLHGSARGAGARRRRARRGTRHERHRGKPNGC